MLILHESDSLFYTKAKGINDNMLFGKTGKQLVKNIIKRSRQDNITAMAAHLSYQLILAFFPFMIFLITIAGYIPQIGDNVLSTLSAILPESAYQIVAAILLNATKHSSSTLLSFSMIASIWITSDGLAVLIKAINKAYGCYEKRRFFRLKGISIFFTLGLAMAIILSVLALVFGEVIAKYLFERLDGTHQFIRFWSLARYPLSLFILICTLSAMYYFLPCNRPAFRMVLPGAVFSALAWVLVSAAISFYFNSFEYFANTYGSIGGIIVLLVWLYWSGIIVILGAEINASVGTIFKS